MHLSSPCFSGPGICTWLSCVLCKPLIKVSVRAAFSDGGANGERRISRLTQDVGIIQFPAAVRFTATYFFKANKESKTLQQVG